MGNCFSTSQRRCGICYFELDEECASLVEPSVHRSYTWRKDSHIHDEERSELPDEQLPYPLPEAWREFLRIGIKAKLSIFQASRQRGCCGCESIVKAIESACADDGVFLDGKCWEEDVQITWTMPSGRDRDLSNLKIDLTVNTSKREAPDRGSEQYHIWTILIDVDRTDDNRKEENYHPFAYKSPVPFNNTGSETSLRKISEWLHECNSMHESCMAGPAAQLPKRVLEMTPDSENNIKVRLVQDVGGQERYVCLSHRWGASTHLCQTTVESLPSHLEEIPWSLLPKTFQDSAKVAVWLGIKYLWIDSLCIIQDSAEDWKEQAAQMCEIYTGGYVTFAAAWSADSDVGLFRESPSFTVEPSAIVGQHGASYLVRRVPEHTTWDVAGVLKMTPELPLLSRAWVYQERLLSPRIVYFTRYEIAFECAGSSRDKICECEHIPGGIWGGGSNGAGTGVGEHTDYRKVYHSEGLAASSLAEIRKYWHQIVAEYSGLRISFTSDRLPALSGVARQYGTAHSSDLGRYVAGMWENCFPSELLWYCASRNIHDRPDFYCGPTWSWISTGNIITYATGCPRTYPDDLEILSIHFKLNGPDKFASISDAVMEVRGYLAAGTLIEVHNALSDTKSIRFEGVAGNSLPFHHDYPLIQPGPKHIPFGSRIFSMKTGFVWGGQHICMLLHQTNVAEDTYERLGLATEVSRADLDSWFVDFKDKKTFKIM
ncbi:HET-domain-containing protein [Trichoderma citrinoviride]|uniref:HET-domain-containing protein n=1 Tax=Trichoderma citrinoviride TaxID=58853 RepID=A0A2T4B829_9HYPO|nr:HET-domain-containing protein [Trichoderma citrinoviride]PTB65482.1 HET-domain-containing protein [Trichoderma citrinoviride]